MLLEPLRPPVARKLILQIIFRGIVTYSQPHAEEQMHKRGISTVDCINILRGGAVDEGEYENSGWRYRVHTPKMCAVNPL